ncbi:MAG: glycoside hydrolase family 16 protein [Gemmatimonadaceae bacterium]|nr:glycoside hydrolase family 16 protein [Gemmatimonadaceae bacterium]
MHLPFRITAVTATRLTALALLVTALAPPLAAQRAARPRSTTPPGWRLAWHDEFAGTTVDTTKWGFDLGNGFTGDNGVYVAGWGNDELQCYTSDPKNVFVSGGSLHLRARRGGAEGCAFTSARLRTRRRDGSALFAATYGRFEFRARLPVGQGIWPALWMLPHDTKYGTWAANGEIDIMEARGQTPSTVLGTLHYGARWPKNVHTGMDYVLPRGGTIADFHVYALEWEPGRIRWLVDGVAYQEQRFWWSSAAMADGQGVMPAGESDLHPWPAPFDRPFHLLMNLAVGGRFLGNPDATTPFPATMEVDWVRVFERRGGAGALSPRGAGLLPWAQPSR